METKKDTDNDRPVLGYRVKDLARLTGASRAAIYAEIAAGRLRAIRFGSRGSIVPADAVKEWLSGNRER